MKKIIVIVLACFLFFPGSVFAFVPDDTYYERQWYLRQINMEDAWEITQGSEDVVVAVIDTGIDIYHPDLDGNIWINVDEIPDNGIDDDGNDYIDDVYGWDFVDEDGTPTADFIQGFNEEGVGHGTAVASIIGAEGNNRNGMAGVTWNSKIMPLKVLDGMGMGYSDDVGRAIHYAIRNKADVINLSFVGFTWNDDMATAIKRAWESGIVVISAGGNTEDEFGGTNLNEYDEFPSCTDQYEDDQYILGVSATDTLDQKAKFSNYGSMCIDIAAPGMDIWSARPYNAEKGYTDFYADDWSGTSFAAPLVSGVAALIKSNNPGLRAQEINDILMQSGVNIDGLNPGYIGELGLRLDAAEALRISQTFAVNGSIIALGSPRGAEPKIYKLDRIASPLVTIQAYENYFLGFDAEIGDINNNGFEEVVIGAGNGGGPQVRIFSSDGRVIGQFFAYDPAFRGGVNVSLGDVNNDGTMEIITAPGRGGGPHVLIYNDHAEIQGNFMAYDPSFRGGIRVAGGDTDGDDDDEIIVAFIDDGKIHVRVFKRSGAEQSSFVIDEGNDGDVYPTAYDIDGDGDSEIALLFSQGDKKILKVVEPDGSLVKTAIWEIDGDIFDVQSFYDYIIGDNRLVLAFEKGAELNIGYLASDLEFVYENNLP